MLDFNFINGEKFSRITGPRIKYFPTHDYWNILSYIVSARKDPDNTYTLITHNSDWSVSKSLEEMGLELRKIPFNLRWFAQNVDVEHKQIESIPIGLENPEWHPKIQKTQKISYCMKYSVRYYSEICMAHFNPSTNARRRLIYDHFRQFDWCDTVESVNGSCFDNYIDRLNNTIFCVCPEGNGIDTHRFWEALYIGCIPIVEDSINVQFYRKLPIFICDNFLDITYDSLMYAKNHIMKNLFTHYDMSMLSFDYWNAKIKNIEVEVETKEEEEEPDYDVG